jgi:glycosyltransferase involved in cell wall biosynthesis
VITTGETGALVRQNDVEGFAATALALLRDDAARGAMGDRARADVLQRYGLDRLVRDVDALYRQLL